MAQPASSSPFLSAPRSIVTEPALRSSCMAHLTIRDKSRDFVKFGAGSHEECRFKRDNSLTRSQTVPATTLEPYSCDATDAILRAIQTDGCALIRASIAPSDAHQARLMIDQLEPIHWDFTGTTNHFKNVFNRDSWWLRFLDRPGIVEV